MNTETNCNRCKEPYSYSCENCKTKLAQPPAPSDEPVTKPEAGSGKIPSVVPCYTFFKQACWLRTRFDICRYLMSNADGRWDGAEKAHRHMNLCYFYVAIVRGLEEDDLEVKYSDDFDAVHDKTSYLTSFMDKEIGFPVKGRPDYDKLAPLFFDKFHSLALEALEINLMADVPSNDQSVCCEVGNHW